MDESTYTCVLQSHLSGRHSVHLDDVADCYCFFSSEPGQTPHITLSRAKWLSTSSLLQAKRRGSVTTCLGGTPCCTVWLAWTLLCFLPPTHSHKSLACSTITDKSSLWDLLLNICVIFTAGKYWFGLFVYCKANCVSLCSMCCRVGCCVSAFLTDHNALI